MSLLSSIKKKGARKVGGGATGVVLCVFEKTASHVDGNVVLKHWDEG